MKLVIAAILIFIFLLRGGEVHADSQVYFAFASESYFVWTLKPVKVEFDYNLINLKTEDFVVRPYIQNGYVEIYDDAKKEWLESSSSINKLPHLKSEMQVRANYGSVQKLNIWFEVISLKNEKVYTTPKRLYWTEKSLNYYLPAVFRNVAESTQSSETTPAVDYTQLQNLAKTSLLPRRRLIVLSMFCFLAFAYVGFSYSFLHGKMGECQN